MQFYDEIEVNIDIALKLICIRLILEISYHEIYVQNVKKWL